MADIDEMFDELIELADKLETLAHDLLLTLNGVRYEVRALKNGA